jgi:hypothetical protein
VTTQKTLERAERELHAGRIWRAKEILRGAIGAGHSDPVLLERYGQLLDALGDRVDAGRYLFASGVREARYEAPIKLFLDRHSRATADQFARLMPRSVRRTAFPELPPALQEDLRHRGVPAAEFTAPHTSAPRLAMRLADRAIAAGAIAVAVLFLVAVVVGIFKILDWTVDLFR